MKQLSFCIFVLGVILSCSSNTIRPPKESWREEINSDFFYFKYTRKIKTEIEDFKNDKIFYKQNLQRIGFWYLPRAEAEQMVQISLDVYKTNISSCGVDPVYLFINSGFGSIYQNYTDEQKINAAQIQRKVFQLYLDEEKELQDSVRQSFLHNMIGRLKENYKELNREEFEKILIRPEAYPIEKVCQFRKNLAEILSKAPENEKTDFYRLYLLGSSLNTEKDIKR